MYVHNVRRWSGAAILFMVSAALLFSVRVMLASAETANTGEITGTVLMADGSPPDFFHVYAFEDFGPPPRSADARQAITNTSTYSIPDLAPGVYIVEVYAEHQGQTFYQYYDGVQTIEEATPVFVAENATISDIDFVLGANYGTISGSITDDAGAPLAGIAINANSMDYLHYGYIETDDNGQYTLSVPASDYIVQFNDYNNNYSSEYYDNAQDEWTATPVTVLAGATTSGIDAVLSQTGGISGTVTLDGQPPEAFQVYAYPQNDGGPPPRSAENRVPSNPDGSYDISGFQPGLYYVVAEIYLDNSILTTYYDGAKNESDATLVEVVNGATTPNINFAIESPASGIISGMVTDEAGNPLADIAVWARTSDYSYFAEAITDANGAYALTLTVDEYIIEFYPYIDGYIGEYYDDTYDWSLATPVLVQENATVSDINAALGSAGQIAGSVMMFDGNPPEYFWVSAYLTTDEAISRTVDFTSAEIRSTDVTSYVIDGLAPGNYIVEVGADYQGNVFYQYYDNVTNSEDALPVPVISGETTNGIDFVVGAGLTMVSGQVTDNNGNPLPNVDVSLWSVDYTNYGWATTDIDGNYTALVTEDSYYVYFHDNNGAYVGEFYDDAQSEADATLVVVGETDILGVDAQLGIGASLAGTAIMSDGNAPEWFEVYLTPVYDDVRGTPQEPSVFRVEATADPYLLTGIEPGNYWVEAYAHYAGNEYHQYYNGVYELEEAEVVTIAAEEQVTGIDFVFGANLGLLSGLVTDQDGNPLEGVEVIASADTYWNYFHAYTDANGEYELALPPNLYFIQFNDYTGLHQSEWFDDAVQQSDALLIPIEPDAPFVADASLDAMGSIAGTVTMADGGAPDWFYVNALPSSDYTPPRVPSQVDGTRSLSETTYLIGGLAPDTYIVEVFAEYQGFYYHAYYEATNDPVDAMPIPVDVGTPVTGIDFVLGGQISFITGRVTDQNDNPLGGIEVAVESADDGWISNWTQTDADGNYQVAVEAGNYYISFHDYANLLYASEYYNDAATQATADLITTTAGSTTTNIDAALGELGRISGVISMPDGSTPEWYNVYVTPAFNDPAGEPAFSSTNSRAEGYEVTGLSTADYIVGIEAYHAGQHYYQYYEGAFFFDDATPVSVVEGSTTSGIDITVGGNMASISGQVTDTAGNPLEHMSVEVTSDNSGYTVYATTSITGGYELQVPPGAYVVYFYDGNGLYSAEYYDNAPSRESAQLVNVTANNGASDIDAILQQAGSIRGLVTMVNGNVPEYFNIAVYANPNQSPIAWGEPIFDDTTGNMTNAYEITGLLPGTYYLQAYIWHNGASYYRWYEAAVSFIDATPVIVQAGNAQDNVNFIIGLADGIVSGYVTDESGQPLSDIQVEAFHVELYPDGSVEMWLDGQFALTDENGYYEMLGLAADRYYIHFYDYNGVYVNEYYDDAYEVTSARFVTFTNGVAENINAALSTGGGISGTVTLGSAELPGAQVWVDVYRYNTIFNYWEWLRWGETNPDGSYLINGLAPGNYRLYFYDHDWAYRAAYYPNAEFLEDSSDVTVVGNDVTANIDVNLADPVPPAADVGGGGAVTIDPWTGEVVIMIDPANLDEDIVVTLPVTCADGSDPTNVELLVGSTVYSMTLFDGVYQVTIPAVDFDTAFISASISVNFDCNGEPQDDPLGTITLYDPSGVVTDASTGEIIEGATVTLFQVPGWLPDTANETRNCRTINTRGGNDWSTVPDVTQDLGVAINDENGMRNGQPLISPFVNPQTTGIDGRYGWDVAEGCWYVVVEADGYETRVSPVVGVPPAVTDLDLTVTRFIPTQIALTATDTATPTSNLAIVLLIVMTIGISLTFLRRRSS